MKIPKPTDASRALFTSLVPEDPRIEVKPMFGNLGAFVNGNMFMGIFGADVGVKLAEADQELLRKAGGQAFGPSERPMGGYVSLPAGCDAAAAEPWVKRALAYVGAQAPKVKKAKR